MALIKSRLWFLYLTVPLIDLSNCHLGGEMAMKAFNSLVLKALKRASNLQWWTLQSTSYLLISYLKLHKVSTIINRTLRKQFKEIVSKIKHNMNNKRLTTWKELFNWTNITRNRMIRTWLLRKTKIKIRILTATKTECILRNSSIIMKTTPTVEVTLTINKHTSRARKATSCSRRQRSNHQIRISQLISYQEVKVMLVDRLE